VSWMSRTSHKLKIASQHALNEQFEFLDDNQMQSDGKVACRPSTFRIEKFTDGPKIHQGINRGRGHERSVRR